MKQLFIYVYNHNHGVDVFPVYRSLEDGIPTKDEAIKHVGEFVWPDEYEPSLRHLPDGEQVCPSRRVRSYDLYDRDLGFVMGLEGPQVLG